VLTKLPTVGPETYKFVVRITDAQSNVTSAATAGHYTLAAPVISFSEGSINTTQPADSVSGSASKAILRFNVTNNGNIASSGTSTADVLASPDDNIGDGIVVGSIPVAIVLNPKARKTITVPLTSMPTVGAGHYTFFVRITDPKSGITFAAGPSFTLAAPFEALSVSSVQSTLPALSSGAETNAVVRFKVTNNGNITSSDDDGQLAASPVGNAAGIISLNDDGEFDGIKPHTSKIITVPLSYGISLPLGTYHVVVQVSGPFDTTPSSATAAAQFTILAAGPSLELVTGHLQKNSAGGAVLTVTVKNNGDTIGGKQNLYVDASDDGSVSFFGMTMLEDPLLDFDIPPNGTKVFHVSITAAELAETQPGWQVVIFLGNNIGAFPTMFLKFPV
jgi:hypothetical protein